MPNGTAVREARVKALRRVYTVDRYGTVTVHRCDTTEPLRQVLPGPVTQ